VSFEGKGVSPCSGLLSFPSLLGHKRKRREGKRSQNPSGASRRKHNKKTEADREYAMNSILRNKLDSRNARLMQAVDPDHLIEEAELRVQARELEVNSKRVSWSHNVLRPCKLVELGYSPGLQGGRKGTVPKPPSEVFESVRTSQSSQPSRQQVDSTKYLSPPPATTSLDSLPLPIPTLDQEQSPTTSPLVQRTLFSESRSGGEAEADYLYRAAKREIRNGEIKEGLELLEKAASAIRLVDNEQKKKAMEKIENLRNALKELSSWERIAPPKSPS